MRVFKLQPRWEEPDAAAQLSLRAVTLLEVVSVICSVLLTVWAVAPIYPQSRWLMAIPGALALALIINSQRLRSETLRELGFTTAHFGRAWRLLAAPLLIGGGTLAAIGYATDSFHRSTNFWANLLVVPAWGVLQQYVLQGFVYRRVRFLLGDERNAPLATAAIFALVHAPNLTLMLLTFVAALIWSWVYERAPNLWALGLSHGLLSLLLMSSLPAWMLQSMSVGYKHFLYRKF